MDRKTARTVVTLLLAVMVVGYLVRQGQDDDSPQPPPTQPTDTRPEDRGSPDPSVHLAMGNPSGATDDPANPDNYLLRKPYFALSYSDSKGIPNWVAWCLTDGDLGTASRGQFYPDPGLPNGFRRVTPRNYTGSGFDRGHLCPRSDRAGTPEAANSTFVMTNIVPQAPRLNQRAWADFEDYCRDLVRHQGRTLYQVAGPLGTGGEGTNGPAEAIAGGRVTVPAKCWKVVLSLEGGAGAAGDASRVGPGTRLIAVMMPNDQSVGR